MISPRWKSCCTALLMGLMLCVVLPKDLVHACAHDHTLQAEEHGSHDGPVLDGSFQCAFCEVVVPVYSTPAEVFVPTGQQFGSAGNVETYAPLALGLLDRGSARAPPLKA